MRLDTKALAIAGALLWGGAVLLVGLAQMIWPGYGRAFLETMASVYPGWAGPGGFGALVVGTLYAALDGAVCGLVLGWLYNRLASGPEGAA